MKLLSYCLLDLRSTWLDIFWILSTLLLIKALYLLEMKQISVPAKKNINKAEGGLELA